MGLRRSSWRLALATAPLLACLAAAAPQAAAAGAASPGQHGHGASEHRGDPHPQKAGHPNERDDSRDGDAEADGDGARPRDHDPRDVDGTVAPAPRSDVEGVTSPAAGASPGLLVHAARSSVSAVSAGSAEPAQTTPPLVEGAPGATSPVGGVALEPAGSATVQWALARLPVGWYAAIGAADVLLTAVLLVRRRRARREHGNS